MADRTAMTPELLVWTENYWIGGCDQFLVDLIRGLEGRAVKIALAGNEHPEFDRWLSARVPQVLPRETLPIANLVQSPLRELERRVRRGGTDARAPSAGSVVDGDRDGPLARDAAIAAVRYGQDLANLRRLRAFMRRRRPDVLLINNGGYPGAESCRLIALAARAAGVPRILHFVHNMANPPAWPQAAERALDRRIDGATDAWITAAHRASAALAARRPIPASHIHTVHYGLERGEPAPVAADRSELGFSDDALALAAIANLEPRKGIATLIRALALLRDQSVPVRTAIVGDGPLRAELEQQVISAGLSDRVRFTGWRDDVGAILSASDALVLPSLSHECLPYVILEAMAARLPVVSTDVAGIPEMVIDGVTGRVVAPGDEPALAAALRGLALSEDRGAGMGERGYARVTEHFTLERMATQMSELIGLA